MLGIVIGLVSVSITGLFIVAIGNWALAARIGVNLVMCGVIASYIISCLFIPVCSLAFPAFAQQSYIAPIDATGKAVCTNCHLAEAPLRLSGPSAVFANTVFDLVVEIPTLVTASQVSAAGDAVGLNVGGVIVLPEGFQKAQGADSSIFSIYSQANSECYVFGPASAVEYSTTVIPISAPADALSLTYPIVVAGNRGRGQVYPDGTPSNNSNFRCSVNGWIGRIHLTREGATIAIWNTNGNVNLTRLPAGMELFDRLLCSLGSRLFADSSLTTNPNVGGVGQSELFLVVQSPERLRYYLQVVLAIAITQLALV